MARPRDPSDARVSGPDRDPSADDGRIGGLAGFRRVAVWSGFSLASSGDCAPRQVRIPTARSRLNQDPLHQHPRRGFSRHQPRPAQLFGVGHGDFHGDFHGDGRPDLFSTIRGRQGPSVRGNSESAPASPAPTRTSSRTVIGLPWHLSIRS